MANYLRARLLFFSLVGKVTMGSPSTDLSFGLSEYLANKKKRNEGKRIKQRAVQTRIKKGALLRKPSTFVRAPPETRSSRRSRPRGEREEKGALSVAVWRNPVLLLTIFAVISFCVNTCFTRVYGFRPSLELKETIGICTLGVLMGAIVVLELVFMVIEEVFRSQEIKGSTRVFVNVANLGILVTVANFALAAMYPDDYARPGEDPASRAMAWGVSSPLPTDDAAAVESGVQWLWNAPGRLVGAVVETTRMMLTMAVFFLTLWVAGPALSILLKSSARGASKLAGPELMAGALLLGVGLVFARRETVTLCFYGSGVGVAASVFRALMDWVEEGMQAAYEKQMDTDEWGVPHTGANAGAGPGTISGAGALSSLVTGLSPLVPWAAPVGPQRPEPAVATLVSASSHLLGAAGGPRPSLKAPSRLVDLLAEYGICDAGGAQALLDFMRTAYDAPPGAPGAPDAAGAGAGAVASSSAQWRRAYNRSVFSCVAASSERAAARMAAIVHATDVYAEGLLATSADLVHGLAAAAGLAGPRKTEPWQWLEHCSAESRQRMWKMLDAGEVELLRACSLAPLEWHRRLTYEAVGARADDFRAVGFRVDAVAAARGKGKTGPLSAAALRYMAGSDSRRAADASEQLWFAAEEDGPTMLRLDKAASGGCSTPAAVAACRDFKARPWLSAAPVPLAAHPAPSAGAGLVYSAGAYRRAADACPGGHELIFTDAEAAELFPRDWNAVEPWCLKGEDATRVRPVCRVVDGK
jgi:hypothetical protein